MPTVNGKFTYFLSDIHLGLPDRKKSLQRELKLVKFLDEIKNSAESIYFAGDIFDFWWEYKSVVPRGYVRFLGKIAELSDSGVKIFFFTGNHDIWMKDYLKEELGTEILHKELKTEIKGKKFYIAHGDGLGPGDKKYKFLKKIFTNRFLQKCFSLLHPDTAFGIAKKWSHSRRKKETSYDFKGKDKELLFLHSEDILKKEHFDYLIYGHRHFPVMLSAGKSSVHINLGDWLVNFTYGIFDGKDFRLKTYKNNKQEDFIVDLNHTIRINLFN
ncbi:MAG: UDP-2,3-diacylglucosamine diphosphatase [Chlorobi bacterium]|nr:UDP-2,3-diacylglucosamine diphosphatase [Chlorobiota bacterium]